MSLPGYLPKVLTICAVACAALYAIGVALLWGSQDRFIYHPSPAVVKPALAFISVVRVPTEDGESLVAWRAPAEPGCPTILFFDGNGGRPEIQNGRWQRMQDAGVGFVGVYWRGYSGSTGAPSEEGFHIDAKAGLKWLVDSGIPASKIVVHGFSIGTGPATRLASENTVAALILEAPYFSMEDLIASKVPLAPTSLLLRSTYRSDEWIGSVTSPIMIAHGSADGFIPESQGRRLFANARDPKTFVSMPGSDHATLARDGLYDHVWNFLATNLPPQDVSSCAGLAKGTPETAQLK